MGSQYRVQDSVRPPHLHGGHLVCLAPLQLRHMGLQLPLLGRQGVGNLPAPPGFQLCTEPEAMTVLGPTESVDMPDSRESSAVEAVETISSLPSSSGLSVVAG